MVSNMAEPATDTGFEVDDIADGEDDLDDLDAVDDAFAGEPDQGDEPEHDEDLDEGDEPEAGDSGPVVAPAPAAPSPQIRRAAARSNRAPELPGLFDPAGAGDDEDDAEPGVWPVPLLEGQEVTGPFFRPAPDGSPMLEVYGMRREGRRMVRGAHLGRVPYDAGEDDVAEVGGPGPRWIAIRDVSGRFIAGNSLLIERTSEPAPAPPVSQAPPAPTSGLEAAIARMMAAQEKRAAALEARLVEMAQQRDAEELRLLRAQMRRGGAGGAAPPAVEDPLEVIERAERLKARFREALGVDKKSEGGGGLLDELDDLLGDLGAGAEGLAKLAGSAAQVADFANKGKRGG